VQVTNTVATNDRRIDALLGSVQWATSGSQSTELTFSFPDASSVWSTAAGEYGAGDAWGPRTGFAPLSDVEKGAVRVALASWAAVANIRFVETADTATGHGTLRFAWTASSVNEQSFTYGPGTGDKAGDVWLNSLAPWDGFAPGTYGFSTLLHEIGHALGLKHPIEGAVVLPAAQDSYAVSLMSETAYAGAAGSWVDFEPTTPMPYDILAVQSLYGANPTERSGDDTYVFTENQRYLQTLWDSGGIDTIAWQGQAQGARIDLNAGHFSQLGESLTYWSADFSSSWQRADTVEIGLGVSIENAIGGDGNDLLIGNALGNRLTAGAGNDTINGMGGTDTVDGGSGTDTLVMQVTTAEVLAHASALVYAPGYISRIGSSLGPVDLTGVERIQLNDGLYAFDTAAPAGNSPGGHVWQAAALYRAGFGFMPTQAELSHWTAEADTSTTMGVLGQQMIDFYAPGISSADFVSYLYQMLVHETPTPAVLQGLVSQVGPAQAFATQGDLFAYAASLSLNTDLMVGLAGSIQALDASFFG